jgi:hypothetical protein
MEVTSRLARDREENARIEREVPRFTVLADLLSWGFRQTPRLDVVDVVVQDEYTHDVVVAWRDGLFLVYDST